jgi:hypothetical protein
MVVAFAGVVVPCLGQTQTILPQIADGGNWRTAVMIVNTTASAGTVSLSFFQAVAAGNTIPWNPPFVEGSSTQNLAVPAGGTVFLHTLGTAALLSQGWGQVNASPGIFAYAIYTYGGIPGRPDQDGTSPAAAAATRILVPYDNRDGFVSSMAIVNPTTSPESVFVSFQNDDGTITLNTLTAPLPANGQLTFTIPQQFPITAGRRGLAEFYVFAGGGLAISAFRFNPTLALTSIPVVLAAGPPIIGAAPPPASLVGKRFVIDGTMVVAGQTVIVQIQATPVGGGAYSVLLSQLAPQFPVYVTFSFGGTIATLVDNTITFSGPTVGGIFNNLNTLYTISSASLTLTVASAQVGGAVSGNTTFTSGAGSISGTITGTITSIQ